MPPDSGNVSPLAALRVRDFRLFWFGLVAQVGGQQMCAFTLGWLAFELTGSQAQLALIQLWGFVPQFALTLLGGVLADRIDPRKLIGTAQLIAAAGIAVAGVMTFLGRPELWHLALCSFLLGLSSALDEPCRAALFPRLIPAAQLPLAVPLMPMAFSVSRIVAPSIAGFLIAGAGASSSFLAALIGAILMIAVLFRVNPRPGAGGALVHGTLLGSLGDSLRYIRSNEVFSKVIAAALLNGTVLMGYVYMLPVFAKDVLGVDARALGILASASGVGSVCGLLSYAWLQARMTPRNAMLRALSLFAVSLTAMALSRDYWLSVGLLFVSGYAQACFLTSCQVTIQTLVEDRYRGRVMGVYTLLWSLVYLSGFLLNLAGEAVGSQAALAVAGVVVLGYAWLSLGRSAALRTLVLAPRTS